MLINPINPAKSMRKYNVQVFSCINCPSVPCESLGDFKDSPGRKLDDYPLAILDRYFYHVNFRSLVFQINYVEDSLFHAV